MTVETTTPTPEVVSTDPVLLRVLEGLLGPFFDKFPDVKQKLAPIYEKSRPMLLKLDGVASVVQSKIPLVQKKWEEIQPYHPLVLLRAIVGLLMCFFGGSFLLLIATTEAMHACGIHIIIDNLTLLYEDLKKILIANAKDNEKDEDGDGVPDVQQTTNVKLLTRKIQLFFVTIDPQRVKSVINALYTVVMGVIATLKVSQARLITLVHAITEAVWPTIQTFVVPVLTSVIPTEYQKWVEPILGYIVNIALLSVGFFVQRIVSSFHTALCGGLMCSRAALKWANLYGLTELNHRDTYLDEIVGYGLALAGLLFQMYVGYTIPFPFNLLLWPATVVEYFIFFIVGNTV